jgi:hypothetical protein
MLKWMIAHDERHISVVLRSLDWMKEKETSLLHEVLHALS